MLLSNEITFDLIEMNKSNFITEEMKANMKIENGETEIIDLSERREENILITSTKRNFHNDIKFTST